jgi:hypothetical protein
MSGLLVPVVLGVVFVLTLIAFLIMGVVAAMADPGPGPCSDPGCVMVDHGGPHSNGCGIIWRDDREVF